MEPCNTLIALESKMGRATSTQTTLCELIETISDVIEAGEERLIPKVVLHLIDSRKIRISTRLRYL